MDFPKSLNAGTARARQSRERWLARCLWLLAAAQAAFALVLAGFNRLTFTRFLAEYVVAGVITTIAFATVGLLIAARHPQNAIGRLLCAIGVLWGSTWIGQYARYTYVTAPGALPGGTLIVGLNFVLLGPTIALTAIVLPVYFPDGRLPSPRWRPALWLTIAATTLFTASIVLSPGPIDGSLPEVSNPFAPPSAAPLLRFLTPTAIALMLASLLAGVLAPIVRFRRAQGIQREQIKWFAYATSLLVAAIVIPAAIYYPDFTHDNALLSGSLLAVAAPLLPIAVGIAILRHRLYDINLIINRTLVYAALTACVAALYVLVVGYLGTLFRTSENLLISLVATGVVAALFQPLRERLQRAVNRLLYGERDEPYAVLARLARQLETAVALESILPTIAETVARSLKLPYVAIAAQREEQHVVVAGYGTPAEAPLVLPLLFQTEQIGQLLLAPRAPGEPLGPADRRLLDDLASQAGVALHAVELTGALRRSRQRLVTAREEERLRMRRDLHDGLGPTLAALPLRIDTARTLMRHDQAAADQALVELKLQAQAAVQDIRQLVYALRPPALDQFGLALALRELAVKAPASDAQISVEVPDDLPALPAAVEVAIYRIVQEALTNVARHARARTCTVRLALESGFRLEIADDGVGLPRAPRSGVGLQSMRERAEELGGDCRVEGRPGGGTRVVVWLPVT
ncbi:MAG TPA: sensor histidine kinase [Roseiflexaceae bacterium]|nr:sensor histidine kinase [Roseiflexaceae bacterium]